MSNPNPAGFFSMPRGEFLDVRPPSLRRTLVLSAGEQLGECSG